MARLDRLAATKEVAQTGAVIGRTFTYPLLEAVIGYDAATLRSALTKLEDFELVLRRGEPPDATYVFKHTLVQEAARESLLKSRRRQLHQRVAEALRDRFMNKAAAEPEIVAYHFTEACIIRNAVEWWTKAGELSMRSSAYAEATAHLQTAFSMVDQLPDGSAERLIRLRLQITYANMLHHTRGQIAPETIDAFGRARQLARLVNDQAQRFSAYYGLWAANMMRVELAPMRELASTFLDEAKHCPELAESQIAHRLVGITYWLGGDYVRALPHLEQAHAASECTSDLALRFGYDPAVVAAFYLGLVLWPTGQVDRATQLTEDAFNLALRTRHIPTIAFAHAFSCLFAAICRRPDKALPHAKQLLGLANEHALPLWLAHGKFYEGWTRACAGDSRGKTQMRDALALFREIDMRYAPLYSTLVAEIEDELNGATTSLELLDEQLASIEKTAERWFESEVHCLRGEFLFRSQPRKISEAEFAARHAIGIARAQSTKTFELRGAISLARVLKNTGRGESARELLVQAVVPFIAQSELPEVTEANCLVASIQS